MSVLGRYCVYDEVNIHAKNCTLIVVSAAHDPNAMGIEQQQQPRVVAEAIKTIACAVEPYVDRLQRRLYDFVDVERKQMFTMYRRELMFIEQQRNDWETYAKQLQTHVANMEQEVLRLQQMVTSLEQENSTLHAHQKATYHGMTAPAGPVTYQSSLVPTPMSTPHMYKDPVYYT